MYDLKCFKAYDIRGVVPQELNEELAYKIGIAYSSIINPSTVIVGYDIRLESLSLTNALIDGLTDAGSNVINIGLCGTEEVYYNSFSNKKIGGGIMITASHNPKGYNGMKMVKADAIPISLNDDLQLIRDFILNDQQIDLREKGLVSLNQDKSNYISHLLGYINISKLKPLKIVANPGNGPAGIIIKLLSKFLPFEFIYINEEPDGNFPNGVPNPMVIENRKVTSDAVIQNKADLGIAWDGDFDRCFLFDENGDFIEGGYIVGLLAEYFLKKKPRAKIIHDPRLVWNILDIVNENKGIALQSKSGHSFIKEKMRLEDAIYGGEISAHHYFKDFAYCDSGMLPWLIITEMISDGNKKLSEMVKARISKFPCSSEINYKVDDKAEIIKTIIKYFTAQEPKIDYTDGISMEFFDWRFNLRESNTENLLRLNVETNGKGKILQECIVEIESIILSNT
ncbi:MAG: phosphomannomutase [Rickettsiales bacterium]|nr:MAG: phosphomannomutase [Rickettsiales bacterium]